MQFATQDQKNATPVQKCIAIFNIAVNYAITFYFSYQFLQSWSFLAMQNFESKLFPAECYV